VPAAAERLVKRNHGQQLIALRARQVKFRREKLLLGFQNLVVTRFACRISF